jgi:hypothetical protein
MNVGRPMLGVEMAHHLISSLILHHHRKITRTNELNLIEFGKYERSHGIGNKKLFIPPTTYSSFGEGRSPTRGHHHTLTMYTIQGTYTEK